MPTESLGQKRYFVSFIDDYSRCCQVYFMRHKSKELHKFKEFEALATNESGLSIGTLRTDNGGEYVSKEFEEFLKSKGIRHELTVPYSTAQNDMLLHQMDVVTAFLNGILEEDIYMQQPAGYVQPGKDGLQVKEIVVWTKTISLVLEQGIKRTYEIS